jgi:hypothetical protein
MANGNPKLGEERSAQKNGAKKPYIKPAFRFEQVFVTTALSCGKIDDHSLSCKTIHKAS